jgi:Protein kinase domain
MRALTADDPRVIGEYRLRARLAAGGMGRVYLGLSPAGRAVAVKVVHPDLARDADFLRRFQQEVVAARAVSGIYTAPVVASGLDERPPWLATAFVPGPALDQLVTEHGPLPEPALWPLLGGLVEALQAIHECGVVHRDLKPANVLLATDGPRVIDFGISRAADGTTLTAAGVVFGTPGYMSPEQAEGKPAGPASDVFALGCVIAYAATGAGPFGAGTAAAVLYRVVHAEAVLDRVPPQLREIVSACLAKDPAARPEPRALAAAIAGREHGTGPSAVAFWPRAVTSLIGDYQARLEQETRAPGLPTREFSGAAAAQPPATLSSPGSRSGWPPPGPGRAGGQAYPGGPGSGPQGSPYPQPRDYRAYAGAQAPQAPPRGYLPEAGPPGYAQPQAPRRAALAPVPSSVLNAVTLMYAGAAYTLIYALGVIVVASAIIKDHPALAATQASSGRATLAGVAFLAVVASLIEIALWLGIAQACKKGKNWARVTGTVLFGLHTLGFLGVLANSHPGIGLTKLLTFVGWLIACGAVVFLWQRPSSAFFRAAALSR